MDMDKLLALRTLAEEGTQIDPSKQRGQALLLPGGEGLGRTFNPVPGRGGV